MTVRELIAELEKMPPGDAVYFLQDWQRGQGVSVVCVCYSAHAGHFIGLA